MSNWRKQILKDKEWEFEYDEYGDTGRYRPAGDSSYFVSERTAEIHFLKKQLAKYVEDADWQPAFYWTGDFEADAILINKPHIEKQGEKEDRTALTLELLKNCADFKVFGMTDALNLQNAFLKRNNWGGVKAGWRQNPAAVFKTDTGRKHEYPSPNEVIDLVDVIFPVRVMDKDALLKWYQQFGVIHPFTDLNGRVGGIIVSVLYHNYLKEKAGQ